MVKSSEVVHFIFTIKHSCLSQRKRTPTATSRKLVGSRCLKTWLNGKMLLRVILFAFDWEGIPDCRSRFIARESWEVLLLLSLFPFSFLPIRQYTHSSMRSFFFSSSSPPVSHFFVLYSIFYYDYQVLAFRLCVGTLRGLSAASQLIEENKERNASFSFPLLFTSIVFFYFFLSLSLFFRVISFPTNNNSSSRLGDIQKSDALPPSLSPLLNNLAIF